jgi:hypothetical protein
LSDHDFALLLLLTAYGAQLFILVEELVAFCLQTLIVRPYGNQFKLLHLILLVHQGDVRLRHILNQLYLRELCHYFKQFRKLPLNCFLVYALHSGLVLHILKLIYHLLVVVSC